jgi:Domain of unknown function (DUF932)
MWNTWSSNKGGKMSIGHVPEFWKGFPVFEYNDRLDELVCILPSFVIRSFGLGDAANEFFNQVVRLPVEGDPRTIPVGVVSRNYKLIQHRDVVSWLRAGLQEARLDKNLADYTLWISKYGERMKLWIELHGLDFDPGDGHPLRAVVACQNSVDGSCALEIKVIQVRTICENGLVSGPGATIRKTHIPQELDQGKIASQIGDSLNNLATEQLIFSRWLNTPVGLAELNTWVNTIVAKKWGQPDAARVASIYRDGWDGKVKPVKDCPPSQWQVGWATIVPGANATVDNVYHAAQALSWVASHNSNLDERSLRINAIPEMVKALIG